MRALNSNSRGEEAAVYADGGDKSIWPTKWETQAARARGVNADVRKTRVLG